MSPDPRKPERRSPESHLAILGAALDLAVETGIANTSIERIAVRAGVGKQTIYRWWPSKGTVVLEALLARVGPDIAFPDTGDLRADLITQMTAAISFFGSENGQVYRGLIGEAQGDSVLAAAIVERLVGPQEQKCVDRLARGQRAGQLRADVDLHAVMEQLYGPLYQRFLLRTRPLPPGHAVRVVELAFAGLLP
jgi:AcrR family transcriptional regulator